MYRQHVPAIVLYNTLSRFAVPCFMMLSGAFLLADEKNRDYLFFYKKTYKKIVIPTLIFSVLYFLYQELKKIVQVSVQGVEYSVLLHPVKAWVRGVPFYHMWYLYTLIGVYLLIPILIRLKDDIGEKVFCKVSWIYMVVAMLSAWTSSFKLHWGISKVIGYVGFVMAGYQIRVRYQDNKKNCRGIFFILGGILAEIILSVIQYQHIMRGVAEADETYSIIGNFNPLVVTASVFIFSGFAQLYIKNDGLYTIASKTFLVYLFHAGVWDNLSKLVQAGVVTTDCRFVIPVGITVVFAISYVLAVLYEKIWAVCDKNGRFSDGLCKVVHLKS